MNIEKINKVKELWRNIHSFHSPVFCWEKHDWMKYYYNETTDSLECECGISIPVEAPLEDINIDYLRDKISDLRYDVLNEYRKNNIDLGWKE